MKQLKALLLTDTSTVLVGSQSRQYSTLLIKYAYFFRQATVRVGRLLLLALLCLARYRYLNSSTALIDGQRAIETSIAPAGHQS
mmetsp:Transcript_21864/g.36584  ORF Transcript_21864/g.36584 Transcript_21864/m.36584 type:complete len:84 (-) Transcript_21864:396-647(-)